MQCMQHVEWCQHRVINSFLCIELLKIAHTVQLHIDKEHRDTKMYDVPNI